MLYLALFISFFKIGLFGFGGGLAILSLIEMEVENHGWMSQQEFVDIVRDVRRLHHRWYLGKSHCYLRHHSAEPDYYA